MDHRARLQLRNIGIIAHVDAGKTTLSERILYYCRATQTMGEVPFGTTVMDFLPEEQKRGITIAAACTRCTWKNWQISLVDTPGHVDFTGEVARTLRVIDGAVVVFSAVDGVESQSEHVWRMADQYGLPRIVFLNKVDRRESDWEQTCADMQKRLTGRFALLTVPICEQDTLTGILDIPGCREYYFDPEDLGSTIHTAAPSPERRMLCSTLYDTLLETLCDVDDRFMQKWADDSVTHRDILSAIARASRRGALVPVFCGSAYRNCGVQLLLDGIGRYLPPPGEVPQPLYDAFGCPVKRRLPRSAFLGLVFKVVTTAHRRLAWMRIYQGEVRRGDILCASRMPNRRIPAELYSLDAEQIHERSVAQAGDIVAVVSSDLQNGDTCLLYSEDAASHAAEDALFLEPLPGAVQVMTQKIEPRSQEEYALLASALERFCEEDTTLRFERDDATGAFHVHGMGELHFAVLHERLEREYSLTLRASSPTVSYRETIERPAASTQDVVLPVGSFTQHGMLTLTVRPGERGAGNSILFAGALQTHVPVTLLRSARQGIENVLARGVLAEWPVTDVCVEVTEILSCGDASTLGTQTAAERALQCALQEASLFLLWPVMHVQIDVAPENVGSAVTRLSAIGHVDGLWEREGVTLITGHAPLENLMGFATTLRSATRGRAEVQLEFSHYTRVGLLS